MKNIMWKKDAILGMAIGALIVSISMTSFADDMLVEDDFFAVVEEGEEVFETEFEIMEEEWVSIPDDDAYLIEEELFYDNNIEAITEDLDENSESLYADASIIANGTCGENLTWTLDSKGKLIISGTGKMQNWDFDNKSPWYYNEAVRDVVISDGVTSIGDHAFFGCGMRSIALPGSVKEIGRPYYDSLCFYYCNNLESIRVDENNSVYDSRGACNAIIETATNRLICGCKNTVIPNSVTSIGDYAFAGNGITGITIPGSVTTIEDSAFQECTSLVSINISNGVTRIGNGAFSDCHKLIDITIPESVSSIGNSGFLGSAFSGCAELTTIRVDDKNKVYDSRGNCNGIIETASNTLICGCKSTVIPNSVTCIGPYAFASQWKMSGIIIPDSITSIDGGAFWSCDGLTSITIPGSVKTIGTAAFADCDKLTSVTLCDGVTTIGSGAFQKCGKLTSITIPRSVTSIYNSYTFYGSVNLTIYGYNGSYAEQFASENYISFVSLGETERTTIMIVLDVNGGTTHEAWSPNQFNLEVTIGENYGYLPTPTRKNYRFAGWYTQKVGGTLITSKSVVSASYKKLYARWEGYPVEVTVFGDGHTELFSEKFDEGYFFNDATEIQAGLCKLSALGSYTIYCGNDSGNTTPLDFLRECGFDDVKKMFTRDGKSNTKSTVYDNHHGTLYIGNRSIIQSDGSEELLVGVVISGYSSGGYEWISNFTVGTDQTHDGFYNAGEEAYRWIKSYTTTVNGDGLPVKYWITGHSRGGALTNIAAMNLINENKTVYAYGFATPRYYANGNFSDVKYKSIINIVSADDFVPSVAPKKWGFGRYGQNKEFNPAYRDDMKQKFYDYFHRKYRGNSTLDVSLLMTGFTQIAPNQAAYNTMGYLPMNLPSIQLDFGIHLYTPFEIGTMLYPYEYCQEGLAKACTSVDSVKIPAIAKMMGWGVYSVKFAAMNLLLIKDKMVHPGIEDAHEMHSYLMWLEAGSTYVEID